MARSARRIFRIVDKSCPSASVRRIESSCTTAEEGAQTAPAVQTAAKYLNVLVT